MLDSGSMVSTISKSFSSELGFTVNPLDELVHIEGAGGHSLEYECYVEAELTIPDPVAKSYHALLLVVPDM